VAIQNGQVMAFTISVSGTLLIMRVVIRIGWAGINGRKCQPSGTQLSASSVDYRGGDDGEEYDENNRRTPVSVEPVKYPGTTLFLLPPVSPFRDL